MFFFFFSGKIRFQLVIYTVLITFSLYVGILVGKFSLKYIKGVIQYTRAFIPLLREKNLGNISLQ